MIIQSKINETKDVMKRKAMEIDKSKLSEAKLVRCSGLSCVLVVPFPALELRSKCSKHCCMPLWPCRQPCAVLSWAQRCSNAKDTASTSAAGPWAVPA